MLLQDLCQHRRCRQPNPRAVFSRVLSDVICSYANDWGGDCAPRLITSERILIERVDDRLVTTALRCASRADLGGK